MSAGKLTLTLKKEMFGDLISKMQDLSNISEIIKLRISPDDIIAYSMISSDTALLVLKHYLLKTDDYIEKFKSEDTFDFIIVNSGKFVKNLKFLDSSNGVEFSINYKLDDEIKHVRACRFSSGKIKISYIGGELSKIKDINTKSLESIIDPKKCKWNFQISKSDFSNIKKLSSINSEDKVINLILKDGKVIFGEDYKWEIEVDDIEFNKDQKLIFNKSYLSNIQEDDIISFDIYDTFIFIKNENSNLMLSFETQFDD